MSPYSYTLLLRLVSPLMLWLLERRAKKAGGHWDIRSPERFGKYKNSVVPTPIDDQQADFEVNAYRFQFTEPVWVHAVSLGETRACQPLVRLLLDQGYPVLLTHMTATGRAQGARLFLEDIGMGRLVQTWVPYDLPEAVEGFFAHWKPRCGILIEREVWPNLLKIAKQQEIPMVLASARFSVSAQKQANFLGAVAREAYQGLDRVLAQSHQDAERLREYGVEHVEVVGNLKFDLNISSNQLEMGRTMREHLARPVIAVASTRDGEEAMFIEAILNRLRHQGASELEPIYVIVPRHPERFSEVETFLRKSALSYVRRSDNPSDEQLAKAQLLLGDSIGEMFFYYGLSDIAIVAGSFADFGGQNHIEACAVGVPVVVGPHTQNFEKYVEDAIVEGAARRVQNASEAVVLANSIIANPELLNTMGQAGKQWLALHQGVSQRIFKMIKPLLGSSRS